MHRVVTVMGRNVSMFELSVPCEVFGLPRPEIPSWDYEHVVCSASGRSDAGQGGLQLRAGHGLEALETADTVVIPAWYIVHRPGWADHDVDPSTAATVAAVGAAHRRGARLVSLCTGAFLLAEAGALDGRRATTHWLHAATLAERYPAVDVDPSVLYVEDGTVFTAAGTASGIDLCLHLVRLDHGAEAANSVARRMVVPPHRAGGQAQFIQAPVPSGADGDPLGELLAWMAEHLAEPLTVEDLARRTSLSPRTFARRFAEATGTSPLRWLLGQRVALARRLLETTDLAVEEVARHCGFSTAAGLRSHFQREVGTSPAAYRRSFQKTPVG
ncbi:MAG TPA: helix-turn-helix domain-containing protein [Aquihabitans sp.]|jgi:transcriptional regulator GlxA family with amidase domain|nr:helix-turn-helix domain-containing protein [Aquihabitans sp.]